MYGIPSPQRRFPVHRPQAWWYSGCQGCTLSSSARGILGHAHSAPPSDDHVLLLMIPSVDGGFLVILSSALSANPMSLSYMRRSSATRMALASSHNSAVTTRSKVRTGRVVICSIHKLSNPSFSLLRILSMRKPWRPSWPQRQPFEYPGRPIVRYVGTDRVLALILLIRCILPNSILLFLQICRHFDIPPPLRHDKERLTLGSTPVDISTPPFI